MAACVHTYKQGKGKRHPYGKILCLLDMLEIVVGSSLVFSFHTCIVRQNLFCIYNTRIGVMENVILKPFVYLQNNLSSIF